MPFYEFEGMRPVVSPETFVDPNAILIGDVSVASGCYIGPGSVLRGDGATITVGKDSNIQDNCVVHTSPGNPTIIHSSVHIGHACILHGCEIFSNVLIGISAIVADDVKIHSYCLVGAASLITAGQEIPGKSLLMGSPAKIVRTLTQEHIDRIAHGLATYQDLVKRYLKSFKEIKL